MSVGDDPQEPRGRLAILHPPGRMSLAHNPFGKDVANLQLWRALARHGGFRRMDVLLMGHATSQQVACDLFGDDPAPTEIVASPYLSSTALADAGALLRGQPYLADLAWRRRRLASDRAYSLIGLIHSLAAPAVRQMIAAAAGAPTHPWDALICTSPSVREAMERMFAEHGQHLAERTGGRPPPLPALPMIPLGVDAEAQAALADRPQARARLRAELGLADEDILVLWVGRLSYYEKAFPQPMFKALQQAKEATGARVVFAMAGWFPAEPDRRLYEQAAAAHAPDVPVRFLDGNDRALLGELWAGSDIFLSLVDNIQETFGITPLEAMAAGLPVVVSDWDGYRSTVRHGIEGFLVETLGGPAAGGLGATLLDRHVFEILTYQAYVGGLAQHTAAHIGRAATALAELIRSPDLRKRMGAAGRARVRDVFDWPVVARQIHALTDDLAQVRAAARDPPVLRRSDPVRGDPFRDFAHFASQPLTLETRLTVTPGATAERVGRTGEVELDDAFPGLRAPPPQCAEAFAFIAERPGVSVRDVLTAFPTPQRRALELGLGWMAKYGYLDWL